MNPMMRRLFHTVRDGLLIVSRDGILRFANEQAHRLLPCELGITVQHPKIERLIRAIEAGHLEMPISEELMFNSSSGDTFGDTVQVHILASPVGTDCIVVMHNLTEQHFFETAVQNLVRMVQNECRHPINDFVDSANQMLTELKLLAPAGSRKLAEALSEVELRGHALVEQFSKLAALAEISYGAPMYAEDRILLPEWISDVATRLESFARARKTRVLSGDLSDSLPAVYGSRLWLGHALEELLRNAIVHSPPDSDIIISAMPSGNHVRIIVRNQGRLMVPMHMRSRPPLPFQRPTQSSIRKSGSILPALGLGLSLVQQIISLHNGKLSVSEDPDSNVSAMLELPAGAPGESSGLDAEQARRYARDITRLIQRRNKKPSKE